MVGGRASHGLIGIDIDTDDAAITGRDRQGAAADAGHRRSARKARRRFFHGPDITTSQSWNIDGKRVCDLIGPGRQTVLPPTIHPDDRGSPIAGKAPGSSITIPKTCR